MFWACFYSLPTLPHRPLIQVILISVIVNCQLFRSLIKQIPLWMLVMNLFPLWCRYDRRFNDYDRRPSEERFDRRSSRREDRYDEYGRERSRRSAERVDEYHSRSRLVLFLFKLKRIQQAHFDMVTESGTQTTKIRNSAVPTYLHIVYLGT